MYLTRHQTAQGIRWALDARLLPQQFNLGLLLELSRSDALRLLQALPYGPVTTDPALPPLEPWHEVWAAGVTYLRSRDARTSESSVADVYQRVYEAERPELFFKCIGWRVKGPGAPIRVRKDSRWNVPEPELTLVVNRHREILGFTSGNDVSSRDIEGENPLYLPQAKIYDGSCALGPGLMIEEAEQMKDMAVRLEIMRNGETAFEGETRTSNMKRSLQELVDYLGRELEFPQGVFLMTGTGIVPPNDFSLQPGDTATVRVGYVRLENSVEE